MNPNKKHEMQQAIAWDLRCLRSGFGRQTYSAKRTEPGTPFGTATRDAYRKQYLSSELAKASVASNSEGAVYKTYAAFGPQCNSIRPTSARAVIGTAPLSMHGYMVTKAGPGAYKHENSFPGNQCTSRRVTSARPMFGRSTRADQAKLYMDQELEKSSAGRGTPGPEYSHLVGIGKQPLSTAPTAPRAHFGTSSRWNAQSNHNLFGTPGAGQYANNKSALGKQVFSSKRSLPSYGFGSSTRDGMKNVFISPEHEKQCHGVGSPGPITARPRSAFHLQVHSSNPTSPCFGFGTAERRPRKEKSFVPGPGTYCA